MPALRPSCFGATLAPFLYPSLLKCTAAGVRRVRCRQYSSHPAHEEASHLNPTPDNYTLTPFADRCILTVEAGAGGHGCVSFVREKYIEEGPPNGGDGGSGGNIYIQAIRGETSLHKLARRRLIKGGRGRNGQGKGRGGERGQDVLITVPVGTIVREIQRHDPIEDAERAQEHAKLFGPPEGEDGEGEEKGSYRKDKWLVFPGTVPSELNRITFPRLPAPRRSHLVGLMPEAPMWLDLDKHMETPMLIAAGAMGGLGNTHFVNIDNWRPKMATRGDEPMKISLQMELKILADLGLVGLPNAGKSTLLRALSNSRARVGSWAFTTLTPNVGTVVLDDHKGRPAVLKRTRDGELRSSFTIADVPGLIEDAHLDKGLGLGFLRHVERAAVLAFVIDLNAGDAVAALKLLWKEVAEYESLREKELNSDTERRMVTYSPPGKGKEARRRRFEEEEAARSKVEFSDTIESLPLLSGSSITAKPWFVAATKADLPKTQENYKALQNYLRDVNSGAEPHPSNRPNAWKDNVQSLPVSAINGHGCEAIPQLVMDLLEQ